MIEKAQIGRVLDRLSAVEAAMGDPSVVADTKRYRETVREHTALKKLESAAKRYFKLLDDIEGAESMLADPDLDPELLSARVGCKGYKELFITQLEDKK